MISQKTKEIIIAAAEKYETTDFIPADPVQFPHRYHKKADIEICGLLTAILSFGSRTQILKKADCLCELMGASPYSYIKERLFEKDFAADDNSSFYRMISHAGFRSVLERLFEAYSQADSLEDFINQAQGNPMEKLCAFLGVSPKSPQKKINMYLRWVVRQNSPVDFGIWKTFNSSELIIPLDTHVAHMAKRFGITDSETYSLAAAKQITRTLNEIFPGDPVKGDFALFGLGVEKAKIPNS